MGATFWLGGHISFYLESYLPGPVMSLILFVSLSVIDKKFGFVRICSDGMNIFKLFIFLFIFLVSYSLFFYCALPKSSNSSVLF